MVCFDITLAYPLQKSERNNIVQEKRIEYLRRHANADRLDWKEGNNVMYIRFSACDEDAIGFLRDIPQPIYCVEIRILRTAELFYTFTKLTGAQVVPPRYSLLDKRVFWAASQLERHLFAV